jgi:succinate-semialdehyde dehydrogenase/glutarate-semialdehyde dehydrogenase
MPIATVNPATGETIRTFTSDDDAAIERKLALASAAAATWRRVPVAERAAVLARAADILEREKVAFGRLMTLEMGKTLAAATEEAAKCATGCRFYAEHGPTFVAPERVRKDGPDDDAWGDWIYYQPVGVVLAVMPWNFPFWQVVRFIAPALVAGNVGLLKHASNVPQCALALEDLFRRAGAPEGAFQALLIGSDRVARVLEDDRVAAATLTGSEPAGSQVGALAGKLIKPSVLELGGSDPFVVLPSADVDAAARTAVTARTINNGQSCIAAKRFVVHAEVYDRFLDCFLAAMRALKVGDPMSPDTNIGPLATPSIADDLEDQVKRAVAAGGRVLLGGKRRAGAGNWFEPTVIVDLPWDAPVAQEETFGPLATVFRARDVDEAIRIANATRFGLGSSAWTTNADEARRLAEELEAGQVFINAMVASDPRYPFGGVKRSGYGRELSREGLRAFVNVKTVRMTKAAKHAETLAE